MESAMERYERLCRFNLAPEDVKEITRLIAKIEEMKIESILRWLRNELD